MPLYANTHTLQSASGKQTTTLREEARANIKQICNATDDHALIFCGSGSTSAVNLLVSRLKIKEIADKVKLSAALDKVLPPDTTEDQPETKKAIFEELDKKNGDTVS